MYTPTAIWSTPTAGYADGRTPTAAVGKAYADGYGGYADGLAVGVLRCSCSVNQEHVPAALPLLG